MTKMTVNQVKTLMSAPANELTVEQLETRLDIVRRCAKAEHDPGYWAANEIAQILYPNLWVERRIPYSEYKQGNYHSVKDSYSADDKTIAVYTLNDRDYI